MAISLTRTRIYDVDADVDMEVDRIDDADKQEVIAYVPVSGIYRGVTIKALDEMLKELKAMLQDGLDTLASDSPLPPSESDNGV